MAEEVTYQDVVQAAINTGRTAEIEAVASEMGYKRPETPPAETPPAETPPAGTPTSGESGENQDGQPPAETPPAGTPPAGDDWSAFGVKDKEELTQRWTALQEVEQKYGEIEKELGTMKAKLEEAEPILAVAPHYKNPFASEGIHRLNNFVSKTGIDDFGVAAQIMSATPESIKADPLLGIAIAEVLKDPSLASVGLDKLRRVAAKENGVDPEQQPSEWDADGRDMVEVRAARVLKTLSEKSAEWNAVDDIFARESQRAQENTRIQGERSQAWNQQVPKLKQAFKDLQIEVETGMGKINATAAISASDIDPVLSHILPTLSSLAPDENGLTRVVQTVDVFLRAAKTPDLIKAAIAEYDKTFRAQIEQEERRKAHNGGQPPAERPGDQPPNQQTKNRALESIVQGMKPKPRTD